MKVLLAFIWLLLRVVVFCAIAGYFILKGGLNWVPGIISALIAYDDFTQINKLLEVR